MKHDSVRGVVPVACESVLDSGLQVEVRVFGRVGAVRGRGTGNGVCAGAVRGRGTGNGVCAGAGRRLGKDTGNGVCARRCDRLLQNTGNGVCRVAGSSCGVLDEVLGFRRVCACWADGTGNRVCLGGRDRRGLRNSGNEVWVVTISSWSVRDGVPEFRRFSSCRGDGTGNGVWGVTGGRSGVVVNGITCSGSRGGVSGR